MYSWWGWQTVGMETRRWLNQSQPQMLQSATLLLYINAVFAVLRIGSPIFLIDVAGAVAAYGIANDKKWGYQLGLAVAFIPTALGVLDLVGITNVLAYRTFDLVVFLLFKLLLVGLLFHPTSKGYVRIWFK